MDRLQFQLKYHTFEAYIKHGIAGAFNDFERELLEIYQTVRMWFLTCYTVVVTERCVFSGQYVIVSAPIFLLASIAAIPEILPTSYRDFITA